MTFLELQQMASDWLDDANNQYYTLPILKIRLNRALKELQKHLISANKEYYSVCVTANTVQNQQIYSLPTDFLQVIRLEWNTGGTGVNANYSQIMPITPNQRDLVDGLSGDPGFYYFQKNNLVLRPIPQRAVTMHLEYSYLVADMVSNSDVPDAPDQFHEYIPILAVRDGFIKGNRPLAPIESKMGEYKNLLKELADQRQADTPRMTVVTGSAGGWGY